VQQLNALRNHFNIDNGNSCNISTRSIEVLDEARFDRIGTYKEYNWNGRRRRLGGKRRRCVGAGTAETDFLERSARSDVVLANDGKKPYAKPNVQSEPIYETLALACGKLPGQGGVCSGAPRRS
jgi:hypothetical protein